ncbi:MAG: flagellar basal body P-ring protein FlgI [Synergistetes bacterium]|nr:flagellar basal body P-ring protein FlgI [Synergistota bacterium]MDW8192951.1 flagellar basal body P-ring protein FlgI [Synergistota bacterium]
MKGFRILVLSILIALALSSIAFGAPKVRIKDIAHIEDARPNQLIGMGLVVGLNGTGDKMKLTPQMMQNMLRFFDLSVAQRNIASRNVAAVMVTANLPPFAKPGMRIDVTVSSLGDARSLEGGQLLLTPLKGPDGKVYAVAQGPVSIGPEGSFPTVGVVTNGAIVEREVPVELSQDGVLSIVLDSPDFTTARRIAESINNSFGNIAEAKDASKVEVKIPLSYRKNLVAFISSLEELEVTPDAPAIVVVNERTGTVVMGENVKISRVAIAHKNFSITVGPAAGAAPPTQGYMIEFPEVTTVGDVVKALNAVGATPKDIIAILQAMKKAGALHAELKTM